MSEAFPTCQDIFLTVAPGAEETRAGNAEMLAIISATNAFQIAFDSGAWQIAQPGLSYQGRPDAMGKRPRFANLRFRNPTGAPIDIVVQVSNGDIFDNRAIFGTGSVPVTPGVGAIFDVRQTDLYLPRAKVASDIAPGSQSIAAGATPVLSNANAARRAITVENRGTGDLYISDFIFSTAIGLRLAAGGRVRLETATIVRVYNPNAFAVDVVYLEEIY